MRKLVLLIAIFTSGFCFSQNPGSIVGVVLDGETNDSPLMMANVTVEGTSITSSTNETGYFYLDNLEQGTYTLKFCFAGYTSKKVEVHVQPEQLTDVNVSLSAISISLNDLALLDDNSSEESN